MGKFAENKSIIRDFADFFYQYNREGAVFYILMWNKASHFLLLTDHEIM